MRVPEYDLSNEATWVVMPAPPVDPSFTAALKEIGGVNPFGEPVLQLVWGATHADPQSVHGGLKYYLCDSPAVLKGFEFVDEAGSLQRVKTLAEVPPSVLVPVPKYESVQLGERRFIVERWRSAAFLERSGRYAETHDTGDSETKIACRNCGAPMSETGREDERVCISCGSRRQRIVEFREIKNERLLKGVPARGVYDFFMRLETTEGFYHPPDGEALEAIRVQWRYQLDTPFAVKSEDAKAGREQKEAAKRKRIGQIWQPENLMNRKKDQETICQPQ